jgi:signal transduction histidine kinase
MRLFQLLNPRRATGLFAVAVLILASGLYIIFDLYLDSVGREIVGSWLQSEAVAIQEGNLLSSITKNQRVLLSSQFVKGVNLVDTSTLSNQSLIEFGDAFKLEIPRDLEPGKVVSLATGFLNRHVYYRVSDRPDLILSFETQSDFLTRGFLGAVSAFIFFLMFFFIKVRKLESRRMEAENKNRFLLGEVAARVAHDIRSPLNTLNAVLETIEDLPPNSRRLLTTAIQRIRDISAGIADQSRLALKEATTTTAVEPTLLFPLIEELVEEKRTQYPDRAAKIRWNPSAQSHSAFANVNSNELRRSLSNLIDNAIEASPKDSAITVSLSANQYRVIIKVVDTGKGLSPKELSRIGEKGFSWGKIGGSGLGVYYAKQSVHAWGGEFVISSELGEGTKIQIQLPRATAPSWFTDEVKIEDYSTVMIVDDDPTVHALWKDRIKNLKTDITIEHFFDPDSATSWIVQNKKSLGKYLLLTDYNLNSQAGNGVTVLERCGLTHPSAVMVTSSHDDRELQERCEKLNVKILPKSVMGYTPIVNGRKDLA